MTDRNEALRLADSIHEMNNAAYMTAIANLNDKNRQQAERIAELEGEIADLHTTMFAAAVEIQKHWEAHCDAEGYGPANLMHRLERGIASQYGYDAKTLQRIEAERDQLRAELALRPWRPISPARIAALWAEACKPERPTPVMVEAFVRLVEADHGIDHARTTHKDEG